MKDLTLFLFEVWFAVQQDIFVVHILNRNHSTERSVMFSSVSGL
jgi:hypothetical protein